MPCRDGSRAPDFFTLPPSFVRAHHQKSRTWEKVRTKGQDMERFKNEDGFEQIASVLKIPYPITHSSRTPRPAYHRIRQHSRKAGWVVSNPPSSAFHSTHRSARVPTVNHASELPSIRTPMHNSREAVRRPGPRKRRELAVEIQVEKSALPVPRSSIIDGLC